MSFWTTILAAAKGAAENLEEQGVEVLLQELHDKDVAEWNIACAGLKIISQKTVKSAFVQALMEGLGAAADASLEANSGDVQDVTASLKQV